MRTGDKSGRCGKIPKSEGNRTQDGGLRGRPRGDKEERSFLSMPRPSTMVGRECRVERLEGRQDTEPPDGEKQEQDNV